MVSILSDERTTRLRGGLSAELGALEDAFYALNARDVLRHCRWNSKLSQTSGKASQKCPTTPSVQLAWCYTFGYE
jgi:hypothetical protein